MTISEAAAKKKRGRPQSVPQAALAMAKTCFPEDSARNSQNRTYANMTTSVLLNGADTMPSEFYWLFNPHTNVVRWGIMAELGRLLWAGCLDEGGVRDLAKHLCEEKPQTKEAIARLRRHRTGKTGKATIQTLLMTLCRAFDACVNAHPEITPSQMVSAVESLLEIVRATTNGDQEDDGA